MAKSCPLVPGEKWQAMDSTVFLACRKNVSLKTFQKAVYASGGLERCLQLKDGNDKNLLHHIVESNNQELLGEVLSQPNASALLSQPDKWGKIPAFYCKDVKVAFTLSSFGEDYSCARGGTDTLLHKAIASDNSLLARFLFLHTRLKDIPDARGLSPLALACLCGNGETAVEIIKLVKKEDLDKKDINGLAPLHYAIFNERHDEKGPASSIIVKALLAAGADPFLQAELDKMSPEHLARKEKKDNIVQILKTFNTGRQVSVSSSAPKEGHSMSDKKNERHKSNIRDLGHLLQKHYSALKGKDLMEVLTKGIASAQTLGMEIIAREERAKGVNEGLKRAEQPVGRGIKALFDPRNEDGSSMNLSPPDEPQGPSM